MPLFILLLIVMLTGCNSSSSSTTGSSGKSDNASAGSKVTDSNKPKRIAFFSSAASNNYLQTAITHAEKTAKDLGMKLDVFDGQFDPLVQLNQIQNAITSGKYDGFVVEANDGNLVCKILTEDAPKAGIAVAAIDIELCGVQDNAPKGVLSFVSGQGLVVYKDIMQKIIKDNPEGGKIAVIGGPATGSNYINMMQAVKSELTSQSNWNLAGEFATDYTANKAYQVAQNVLQANPDLDVIFSNYSGMTVGVVEAVKSANRKNVKIYDFGGDQWSFKSVENGDIQQTVIMLPKEEVQRGLEALHDHFNGKEVKKFYNLTQEEILPGTPYVEKDNIKEFKAKGLPEY